MMTAKQIFRKLINILYHNLYVTGFSCGTKTVMRTDQNSYCIWQNASAFE